MACDLYAMAIHNVWTGCMADRFDPNRTRLVLYFKDGDHEIQWFADFANFIASIKVVTQMSF